MVSGERWKTAQGYERGYWEHVAETVASGSVQKIGFYEWRANELRKRLQRLGLDDLVGGQARVVEIGGGPVGILPHFAAVERESIDPLESYYRTNPEFSPFRSSEVTYREGVGESLPSETSRFDLAIIENCIDHVQDVDAVLEEIRRVLKPGGVLYLTVNVRSAWGYWVHRGLARFALDPGHPHTFTARGIVRRVEKHGFEVRDLERAPLKEAWLGDLKAPSLKRRTKAILGVTAFVVWLVARAPEATQKIV